MSIYKNHEGYADPTAGQAIARASRVPLVFISSPYGADPEGNTVKARIYCRFAVDKGAVPLAPHLLYPQFLSEEKERSLALTFGLRLLDRCDEMWVFGIPSPGMKAEITRARNKRIPIRFFRETITPRGTNVSEVSVNDRV